MATIRTYRISYVCKNGVRSGYVDKDGDSAMNAIANAPELGTINTSSEIVNLAVVKINERETE